MNDRVIFKNVEHKHIINYYSVDITARNCYRYSYFASVDFAEVSEIFNRVLKELRKNDPDNDDKNVMILEHSIHSRGQGWNVLVSACRENNWAIELVQTAFESFAEDEK